MNKKWQIYEADKKKIEEIIKELKIDKLLATILVNRNIEKNQIKNFLMPTRNDFYDPFLMPDMEKAVERIIKAIEEKEKIIIYGDYDVDGITSITVLKSFFKDRGIEVDEYIPNRLEEGYGLNKTAIDEIIKKKYDLMITVDCGISAIEEIEYAKEKGLETIITDHHEVSQILPDALAIINVKRKDNTYPFRELAGVGVVFKLIQALSIKLELEEKEYLKYLDIVCVGTISDIVPLVDENRIIAKLGMMLVNQTKNLGLKALINSSGYKKIDSNAISFGVAPRINACGRMGHANDALKLLLSNDIYEVNELTEKLNKYNKLRQETEKNIYEEALNQIKKNKLEKKNTIIVGGKDWHHGVIGIVASKITDLYFKPSILLCYEGDIAKGSGRSIPGFDLHKALTECTENIEKFGGHSMAIGISIKKKKLESFIKQLENIALREKVDEIVPIINIDAIINLCDINQQLIDDLKEMQPYGEGNKMPVFLLKKLKIDSIRALSEGKHIKMTLKDNSNIVNAIGFNLGHLVNEYKIGDKIDVVGIIEVNTYNGVNNLQINIKDIMKSI